MLHSVVLVTHRFWRLSMNEFMSIDDNRTKSPTPNSGPSCTPAIATTAA